jgi:hypothetical protein
MTSAFPSPPPQPRRPVRSILIVGIPVLVIGALVTAMLLYVNRPIDGLEPIGQPTPGSADPTTPPTPTATRSFSTVPDTAGQAKGQAQVLTGLLRGQGLACSDEHVDDRVVYSRGCYRTGPKHMAAVEFIGPPDGTLARVEIDVNYGGAPDSDTARDDHDALVGLFIKAAGIPERDARTITTRLSTDTERFSVPWGGVELQRSSGSSKVALRRTGWKYPLLKTATLPGPLGRVASAATERGYTCRNDTETMLDCTQSLGTSKSDVERKLKVFATARADGRTLERLYVIADTGRDDAADRAVQEQAAVLTALGGPRAAPLKQWYGAHRGRANAKAYVAGMHATVTAGDPRLLPGHVQFDLWSPCWPDAVGFC